MTRTLAALVAALTAAPAFGQGFSQPLPTPPPVPVPGTRMFYPAASPFTPPYFHAPMGRRGFTPWAGYGFAPVYGHGWGWGGFGPYYAPAFGYPYGTASSWGTSFYGPTTAPPLMGAGTVGRDVPAPLNPALTAELTVEFPAPAEVWLNGSPAPGEGAVRTLTSPPLAAGRSYSFAVRAKWESGGRKYEWERTVTLGPGDRSRITVARGFPVDD